MYGIYEVYPYYPNLYRISLIVVEFFLPTKQMMSFTNLHNQSTSDGFVVKSATMGLPNSLCSLNL